MSNYLEQSAIDVQLGKAPWHKATSVALCMGRVGIVDAAAAGAIELAADRAG